MLLSLVNNIKYNNELRLISNNEFTYIMDDINEIWLLWSQLF